MSGQAGVQVEKRGSRVKVCGALLALVLLENGRQIHARISQLSVNGGLLALERPLDEAIKVTVVFHIGTSSLRCPAEMLFPMWATKGCLQPFRFRKLEEKDHAALSRELGALVKAGALQEEELAPEERETTAQPELTPSGADPVAEEQTHATHELKDAFQELAVTPEETPVVPEEQMAASHEQELIFPEPAAAPEEAQVVPEEQTAATHEPELIFPEPVAAPEEAQVLPEEPQFTSQDQAAAFPDHETTD